MKRKSNYVHSPTPGANNRNLAAKETSPKTTARRDGYITRIVPKAVSQVRTDISTWKSALRAAGSVDNPKRAKLQRLYADIMQCAHLTSQTELRLKHVLSTPFVLKKENGQEDEESTALLASASWKRKLDRIGLQTDLFGHSLVEFSRDTAGRLEVALIPRTNVVPEQGVVLLSEDDDTGIRYRDTREYGSWLIEFGETKDYGLLNKAVPHVLFMRFAQACWSELCEIYAIPPRVLKTNTQDTEMLNRAEAMMRDMGAAAWFIIDSTEEFSFAKGADTNGDVYKNLIAVCKEEISVLINGAVLGQDTLNGNRSKEESSTKLFEKIVQDDRVRLQAYWNEVILPALSAIGMLPTGLTYQYQKEEDLERLWGQTHEAMQYFHVDPAWVKSKFGIEVTKERDGGLPGQLSVRDAFFV